MTNQRLRQIFNMCLDSFEQRLNPRPGICSHLLSLDISDDEFSDALTEFKSRKPSYDDRYLKFADSKSYTDGIFWWRNDESGREQRILFLKAIIEELK